MQKHIVKAFDAEIDDLNKKVTAMGKACEEQIVKAVNALGSMDTALAQSVVKQDKVINQLQRGIEERSVSLLTRRHPLAGDLRHLLSVMKIASELERIGDYAANMAKRILALSLSPGQEPIDLIVDMADISRTMIHDVMDAFLNMDVEKAVKVWQTDNLIDRKFARMMAMVRKQMQEKTDQIDDGTQFIFMGRCCERIGDHITNIAEDVYYMATGQIYMDQCSEDHLVC